MLQIDVPKDYDYIGFRCLDDVWNEYILDDKTIIKIKTVILKIIDRGNDEHSLNETNLIITYSPSQLRGRPSAEKLSIPELATAEDTTDIGFKESVGQWIRYELENGLKIDLKPMLISVSRTNKFDSHGEPVYLIQTHTLHKIIPKKKKSQEN